MLVSHPLGNFYQAS